MGKSVPRGLFSAAMFVAVKGCNTWLLTLPGLLFLIGYCETSIGGSPTLDHKYQTCLMCMIRD